VKFHMPAIARGALRYDATTRLWNVEGAFVYENWSRNDEVLFSPKQPGGIALILDDESLRFPVNDIRIPTHFRDTWSLRFGGETQVMPGRLTLRSGVFYERAAISPEWINVGNFDLDKAGISVGGRYDFQKRAFVELCAGYQHWFPVDVSNSRVRIIDPLSSEQKWPVGNGKYSNTRIQVMGAVGVSFGKT
jgi:long-subunit fatty acid transport protein